MSKKRSVRSEDGSVLWEYKEKPTEGYRDSGEEPKRCDGVDPPSWKIYALGVWSLTLSSWSLALSALRVLYVFFFGGFYMIAWELANSVRKRGRKRLGLDAGELPPPRACFTYAAEDGWRWLERLLPGFMLNIFICFVVFFIIAHNGVL